MSTYSRCGSLIDNSYNNIVINNKKRFSSETYKQYAADISRCWATYGLRLLKKSKTRLMKNKTHREPPGTYKFAVLRGLLFII